MLPNQFRRLSRRRRRPHVAATEHPAVRGHHNVLLQIPTSATTVPACGSFLTLKASGDQPLLVTALRGTPHRGRHISTSEAPPRRTSRPATPLMHPSVRPSLPASHLALPASLSRPIRALAVAGDLGEVRIAASRDAEGHEALLPRSKEPFETGEIVAFLTLPSVDASGRPVYVGSIRVGDNLEWQGVKVLICALCTGGWRKEAIALGKDEKPGFREALHWAAHVARGIG